jgi:ubiquinone/menaquinone biosynthesis C-methylase UbiE
MGEKVFQEAFSDEPLMDFWEDVYERQDSYGISIAQRLKTAMSWVDKCGLTKDTMILDAGCGAGNAVFEMAQNGHKFVGMDYSFGMIHKTLKKFDTNNRPKVFLQGDVESLPFRNASFDAVICLGVLTYLKNESAALRELYRILKPQGNLILSIVNKARIISRLDLPTLVQRRFQKSFRSRRSYFIPAIKKSLQKQGFSIIEYTTLPHGGFKFFNRDILPKNTNYNISMFLEKCSNIPKIDSFGGICVLRSKKTTITD